MALAGGLCDRVLPLVVPLSLVGRGMPVSKVLSNDLHVLIACAGLPHPSTIPSRQWHIFFWKHGALCFSLLVGVFSRQHVLSAPAVLGVRSVLYAACPVPTHRLCHLTYAGCWQPSLMAHLSLQASLLLHSSLEA